MNEDTILVERLRAGDPAAILKIQEKYRKRLLGSAYRIMYDRDLAQDAVQEVWTKLFMAKDKLRDGCLGGWLGRTLTNVCYDLNRKRKHEVVTDVPNDVILPAKERVPRIDVVINCMRKLRREDAEVLALRHFFSVTVEEIGVLLLYPGVPTATVYCRIDRAEKKLRDRLQDL